MYWDCEPLMVLKQLYHIHNPEPSSVALIDLTFPLDSKDHIEEADRLRIKTVEISVLRHYQPSYIQHFKSFVDFIQPQPSLSFDRLLMMQQQLAYSASRKFS